MQLINKSGLKFYVIERLQDIQNQMLKLLRIIDSICRENGFQYWLDGGTAIGAYRHGGFIPWDDDLDINILKPDYLKLLDILKRMDRKKYFLFDYEMELHPAAFFGEKVPFFACSDGKRRHIYPIKIDIIPINFIENSTESIKENRVLRELSNLLFLGNCSEEYRPLAEEVFRVKFHGRVKEFMHFYNFEYGLYEDHKNALMSRPSMSFSTPKVYKYSDYLPLREIDFAGVKSFVPVSDMWLKDTYGNYMEYPKLEDRKPEADRVFDAMKPEPLYKYLIDKRPKSRLQTLLFSLQATVSCK